VSVGIDRIPQQAKRKRQHKQAKHEVLDDVLRVRRHLREGIKGLYLSLVLNWPERPLLRTLRPDTVIHSDTCIKVVFERHCIPPIPGCDSGLAQF
jgi:hypothetical protein